MGYRPSILRTLPEEPPMPEHHQSHPDRQLHRRRPFLRPLETFATLWYHQSPLGRQPPYLHQLHQPVVCVRFAVDLFRCLLNL